MMKRLYICLTVTCAVFCQYSALAQTSKIFDEAPTAGPADVIFSSSALQQGLRGSGDLSALAQENSALGDTATAYGFAAKSDEANIFLIGALYSEALAFIAGGDNELAADRLRAIQDQFIQLGVKSSLYGLISKTLSHVEGERYSNDARLEMLSLFQPFFEDYAGERSQDFLILFRAGSWLVDLRLAAAAGENALLRQQDHLGYIRSEMQRMDAPNGVIDALAEISEVVVKDEIMARDRQNLIDQVKRIQSLLG